MQTADSNTGAQNSVGLPAREPQRLDYVDGMRAVAALFVVLCHAYYEPANGYYAARWMSKLGLHYGNLAVVVFIVLSGYCLMLPVARRGMQLGSVRTFFLRRAQRILPPYYAALLLAGVFTLVFAQQPTGTVWDVTLPLTWQSFVAQLLLVHNWTFAWAAQHAPHPLQHGYINYPLWTIAVEAQIYLLMPLLVVLFRRCGDTGTLLVSIGAGLVFHALTGSAWMDTRFWYVGLFACGCMAARMSVARRVGAWWGPAGIVIWLVIGVVILGKGRQFYQSNVIVLDTLVGFATALLLGALFADSSAYPVHPVRRFPLNALLSWKPLVQIGVFSYSVYLIHAPLLHAFWLLLRGFVPDPHGPLMFALLLGTLPVVVLISYGFFLLVEQPLLRRRANRTQMSTPE